jgi:hypothetical protein
MSSEDFNEAWANNLRIHIVQRFGSICIATTGYRLKPSSFDFDWLVRCIRQFVIQQICRKKTKVKTSISEYTPTPRPVAEPGGAGRGRGPPT